jgi:Cu/Ag efflux protein CusF
MWLLRLGILLALFCSGCSAAHAEVIDLEGTVKAIDASSRSITIERKTPKGTKTLELEVTRKTGDLAAVKVGDRISFSYDPDLELVTKIEVGYQPADTGSGPTACRVRIVMGDTGDASVEVQRVELSPKEGKATRDNLGNGVWQVTHYFAKPNDLRLFDSPLGKPVNAAVNPNRKALVLSPEKSPGFENPAAQCRYPLRMRVPFEIEVDVTTTAKEGWPFLQIYLMPLRDGMERPVFNFRTKSALEEGLVFDAWSGKMGVKDEGTHVVTETKIDLQSEWQKTFRLPLPNIKNQDVYTLTIGALGPPADKTFIHRIAVKGFPVPLMGMQLDQSGDVVYAKAINPGLAAAKSGVQEGDVILAINGIKPLSRENAIELLAKTGFGEQCEITVKRGSEEVRVMLKPEWDE